MSPLSPSQQAIYDQIVGKNKSIKRVDYSYYDGIHTWSNSSMPDKYGNVRINIEPAKAAEFMATKKFVANLVIEENTTDKYQNNVKVNLVAIALTDDNLDELLAKAHGHLDLVAPLQGEIK